MFGGPREGGIAGRPNGKSPCRWASFNRAAICFFHLVRRFWNHVLICTSVRFNVFDNSNLLDTDRYLSAWKRKVRPYRYMSQCWNEQSLFWGQSPFANFWKHRPCDALTLNSPSSFSSCFALYACLGLRSIPGFRALLPTGLGAKQIVDIWIRGLTDIKYILNAKKLIRQEVWCMKIS